MDAFAREIGTQFMHRLEVGVDVCPELLFRLGNLRRSPVHTGERSERKMRLVGDHGTEPRITGEQLEQDRRAGSRWSDDEHRLEDLFVEDVGMCSPVVGETATGLEVADDLGSGREAPEDGEPGTCVKVFDQLPVAGFPVIVVRRVGEAGRLLGNGEQFVGI